MYTSTPVHKPGFSTSNPVMPLVIGAETGFLDIKVKYSTLDLFF